MIAVKSSQNVNFHIASAHLKHVHRTTPCMASDSPAHSIVQTSALTPCRSDVPFSRYSPGGTPVSSAFGRFRPFRAHIFPCWAYGEIGRFPARATCHPATPWTPNSTVHVLVTSSTRRAKFSPRGHTPSGLGTTPKHTTAPVQTHTHTHRQTGFHFTNSIVDWTTM